MEVRLPLRICEWNNKAAVFLGEENGLARIIPLGSVLTVKAEGVSLLEYGEDT